jgi:hypothetical protein
MKAETHPLYEKLNRFPLDGADDPFPFSRRLRKENGWTEDYTRRVLTEYRRFLFLAGSAGHPVSPPDAVDQVWHLHMVYTRSYWDELCGETLGFPLHHGPTRGGQAEADKFNDWYANTLDSYREWFGAEPPVDIWLPPAERYRRERNQFRRVNLSDNWVIPKRLPQPIFGVGFLITLGGIPFIMGATGGDSGFALFFIVLFMIALIVCFFASLSPKRASERTTTSGNSGATGGDSGMILYSGGDGHSHAQGQGDCGESGGADGGCDGGDGGSSGCGSSGCGGGGCGS